MTWSDDRFACTHCDPPGHECSTADDCVLPDCPVEQRRCNTYTYDCHYCPAVWDGRCEYYPATGSSCACEAA
jgi:hypothetical protein